MFRFGIRKAVDGDQHLDCAGVLLIFADRTIFVRPDDEVAPALNNLTGTWASVVERSGGVVALRQTFRDHGFAEGSTCLVTRTPRIAILGGMEGTRVMTPKGQGTVLKKGFTSIS